MRPQIKLFQTCFGIATRLVLPEYGFAFAESFRPSPTSWLPPPPLPTSMPHACCMHINAAMERKAGQYKDAKRGEVPKRIVCKKRKPNKCRKVDRCICLPGTYERERPKKCKKGAGHKCPRRISKNKKRYYPK